MTESRRLRALLSAIVVCQLAASAADWPMWRYDAGRTAASPAELPAQLHLQWQRALPPPRPAFPIYPRLRFDGSYEPVAMGKTLFVPSMVTDSVTALDTETGAERWTFFADGPVRFAPVAWRGKVHFVSDDGHLYCLDAATGKRLWAVRGAPKGRQGPRLLGNGRLISRWPARGGPVVADGVVYFAAGVWPFEGVYVHAVDAETGKAVWTNAACGFIKNGLIDHGARRDGGLSPQGYLAVLGDKLVVPSGRALPGFLDTKTGKLEPYTTGWGGRVALAKGCWWVCGVGDYLFQNGELFGLTPRATASVSGPEPGDLMSPEDLAKQARVPLPTIRGWIKKGLLPTVERDGKRLVRLPVPKGATYLSWFTLPCRVGEKHALDTRPRLQLDPANAKEFGEPREPVLTAEAIYYSRPVNKRIGRSYRPVGQGYDGIVACDAAHPKWSVTCCQGYSRGARIFTPRVLAFDELWRLPSTLKVHIKAGCRSERAGAGLPVAGKLPRAAAARRLYAGGPGAVAAIDVPTQGGQPKVSWQAKLQGTPSRMLAADGKLFVVTREGTLYCFGAKAGQPRVHAMATLPAAAPADEWTRRAADILKQTGASEGYCVALGVGTGRLVEELARQSTLHLIVLEPDAAKVDAARRKLVAMGLYGSRIHVVGGDLASARLPLYMASLVVSEAAEPFEARGAGAFARAVFDVLRPYGGVACLALSPARRTSLASAVTQAKLAGAEVARAGAFTCLRRQGPLAGSAGWTHPLADAANSLTSRDQRVKPPFGVLWFGGEVDGIFPTWDYTHSRYPPPLVVGGRMFIQVGTTLHAVDPYTGRRLWHVQTPEPQTKRRGHPYAVAADGITLACDGACLRLDPATGDKVHQLDAPEGKAKGKPGRWSDLRLWEDTLIGSVGSRLVCVDRRTGTERWAYSLPRRLASFAIGRGRVYCADGAPSQRKGKAGKPDGTVLALDARNGKVLWESPVKSRSGKRVQLQLAYCDRTDVLVAVHEAVTALKGASGAPLWTRAIRGCKPCILQAGRLITQEGQWFDALTGKPLPGRFWKGPTNRATRGCNYAIGGQHLVAVRDGYSSYFDLTTCRQTLFRGVRSGCTNSLIAADGLLNSPNYARGCSCNYPVFTSMAFVHMPQAAAWATRPPPRR